MVRPPPGALLKNLFKEKARDLPIAEAEKHRFFELDGWLFRGTVQIFHDRGNPVKASESGQARR
jgi:hypothetical protein